ncbi:hypothetical protein RR46_12734 [Papilio xuthus]|uniref:Uncharacterized protein n=1 Tax=Papilio xuthus TaxID=66420 RepID=A0A194PVB9_PAPXU|nr:hypothetical protein RR46_12734 [Papilio xuthus]
MVSVCELCCGRQYGVAATSCAANGHHQPDRRHHHHHHQHHQHADVPPQWVRPRSPHVANITSLCTSRTHR